MGRAGVVLRLGLALLSAAGRASAEAEAGAALRDAILCQAEARLSSFEHGRRELGEKKERDGVEVYFSGSATCGGQETPIIFANWSLPGVRPRHVFSAIADVQRQQWTGELSRVRILTDGLPVRARGVMLQYEVAPMLSDRRVHEWETYGKTPDENEYLYAASSAHNDVLRGLDPNDGSGGFFGFHKPVECDACLSAHHVIATKDGVRGTFTTNVNGHPPLGLHPSFVAKLTWGKTADFVTKLKSRALQLAQLERGDVWRPPARLMTERRELVAKAHGDKCANAWAQAQAELRGLRSTVGLAALPPAAGAASSAGAQAIPAFCAAGLLVALSMMAVWRRRRRTALPESASFLRADEAPEEAA